MVLFVICLLALAGTAISNYRNLQKLKQNNDQIEHSWSIKNHLKNINLLIADAESGLRGYYMTNDPAFLSPFQTAKEGFGSEFTALGVLVNGNPHQEKNLAQLRLLVERRMAKLDEKTAHFKSGGLSEVVSAVKRREGNEIMDEVRLLDTIMEKEELELLSVRRNRFYEEYQRALWIGNLINGATILILIIFFRLIQKNFAKQRTVEDALKRANDNLETTVSARTAQLSLLSRYLLNVSEAEKAKLARELHDEMGSSLTAISMDLTIVTEKLKKTDPALANQLLRAKKTLQETVDLKRRIIEDLRPSMLDNLGLAASIRNHCEKVARIPGLSCEVDISEEFDNIDPESAIALFRIVQESLNNVIKYAKANHVKITLQRKTSVLWLQILDDGIGLPKDALEKPKSHGLLGMRERALLLDGSFTAQRGHANRGTSIEVCLPFRQ